MQNLREAKVIAFLCTRDRARAIHFYKEILGLAVTHEDEFAVVFDANGTMLRVATKPNLRAQEFTVLGWQVDDLAAVIAGLASKGVCFERFAGMEQDKTGIWRPSGGATQVVWFKDPDGNLLSLTQF
jgi:catechol 2,3-dioxygenase-like lactoylglutathione lyase family enzyme